MTAAPLEPLRFRRHCVEKVWGGRALEQRFGFELPPGKPIGETWEVVDREGENSIVAAGTFAGTSLRELMETRADELLGSARPAPGGRFPLLVKYIDASNDLSVQVHPDAEAAAELGGGAEAKTEAWLVVDVAPGGKLYAGLRPEVERSEFERVSAGPGVVDTLAVWDVARDDCLLVPGGTIHAIGKGVTILEVQENSDTTYRLYDWGRVGLDGKPRATHVAEALRCVRSGEGVAPIRTIRVDWAGSERRTLTACDVFTVEAQALRGEMRGTTGGCVRVLAVLAGSGTLRVEGRSENWRVGPGDVWVLPASLGYHALAPDEGTELRSVWTTPRAD